MPFSFVFSDLARILLQIALILLTAMVLQPALRRIHQPKVISELWAGILLGPSLLGLLWPAGFDWLFSPATLHGLKLLSGFGVVLFMFLVGLELRASALLARAKAALSIGSISMLVPLVVVGGMAWIGYPALEESTPRLAFAIFVGAALSVTALPVLARILNEQNLMHTELASLALAAVAVSDVLAWGAVILFDAPASTESRWTLGAVMLLRAALLIGPLLLVRPWLARWIQHVERFGLASTTFAQLLLAPFLFAAWAELLGIHAFFAAFLMGVALPAQRTLIETVNERLDGSLNVILLPLFFAYSGLRTELHTLLRPRDLLWLAILLIGAFYAKYLSTYLAARWQQLPRSDAMRLGVLLNTRGLMALVLLNAGLDADIVSARVFTMLVVVALLTTMFTGPALQRLSAISPPSKAEAFQAAAVPSSIGIPESNAPHALSRTSTQAETSLATSTSAPAANRRDAFILACISDPSSGPRLAQVAAWFTHGAEHAKVWGLHLPAPADHASSIAPENSQNGDVLRPFLHKATAYAYDVKGTSFVSTRPARDILRMAQSKHADWILLGAHNPLFFDGPLDGVVRDVLHGSHTGVCVLVSTGDEGWEHQRIQRVVVGMFHNEDLAVDTIARQLATSLSVEVCTNTPERAAALRDVPNLRCSTLLGNDPLLAFVEHVQDSDADLVILPYLSEWRLRRGSAGERGRTLFQRLDRPIMIVHQPRIDHDGDQEPR